MNDRKAISVVSLVIIFLMFLFYIFRTEMDNVVIPVNSININYSVSDASITTDKETVKDNIEISDNGTENIKLSTFEYAKAGLEKKLDIITEYLKTINSDKTTGDFVEWFCARYSIQIVNELGLNGGKDINRDCYTYTGKSLFVLCDEFLENKENIYKEAKVSSEVNILFAGDVCLAEDGFVLDYYDTTSGLKDCISEKIIEKCNDADIFMLNNEFSISDRGEAIPGKLYTFRAKPERIEIIKELGTDIVSVANNHIYDFGLQAFNDTIDIINNSGIKTVGGGKNSEEAEKVVYYVVNGLKIGFVSASRAEKVRYTPGAKEETPGIFLMYDDTRLNEVIEKSDKQCDYLIAYIHWGTEDSKFYEEYQREIAKKMIESGVDAIIGGHPHILQGMEYIDGKPVVYSLGDFWFNDETKYNGMINLKIDINGLKSMNFIPCMQTGYKTLYLEDKEMQAKAFSYLRELSPECSVNDDGEIVIKKTENQK